ncbi:sporulation protein YunB [Harryflintia acetispora]|uniref:sporulation protein YunB n=1 Tax=Harryflintia acetispora TaxID=1849041 RepID=UPI00189C0732
MRHRRWHRMPRIEAHHLRSIRLILLALLLIFSLFYADRQVRPIVRTMSGYIAQNVCTQAINNAVIGELRQDGIDYESLVAVSRDLDGKVTSIETDVSRINLFKAQVTGRIIEALQADEIHNLYVPAGTLLDSPLLSGRGPKLNLKVVPASTVATDIVGEFTSSSINQTRHQLYLTVGVDVTAVLPGVSTPLHIDTRFLIAETVIVGEVPQAFTEVYGDGSGLPNKVEDYGAATALPDLTP